MAVNREMFAEIYDLITEYPELHRQSSWETDPAETNLCGTTRCIAGWAVWIGARDAELLTSKRHMTGQKIRARLARLLRLGWGSYKDDDYLGDFRPDEYPVLGTELLGLTSGQARSLFHDYETERVVARVKSYAETGEDISDEEYYRYE